MQIKAKLWVNKITKSVGVETVELVAVTSGSEENKTYSKYTPAANFTLSITNPDVFGYFNPGSEYVITFNESETE